MYKPAATGTRRLQKVQKGCKGYKKAAKGVIDLVQVFAAENKASNAQSMPGMPCYVAIFPNVSAGEVEKNDCNSIE